MVKVQLKLRGVNAVMRGPGATAEVIRRATRIKNAAGPDFEVVARPHRWVARAFVQPANTEGAVQEARDKRLTRSLDAAR